MLQVNQEQVLNVIRDRYHESSLIHTITRLRPYICPFAEIINHLPVVNNMYDAGCGTGIMCHLAEEFGIAKHCLGTDTSQSAIKVALAAKKPGANLTFQYLPPDKFPLQHFDLITCIDVVHHIPKSEQQQYIQKLISLLNPNGYLVIKDISPRPRWKAAANILHDLIMARQLVNLRPKKTLVNWLTQSSLTIQTPERLDRLWYSHYLLIARKS